MSKQPTVERAAKTPPMVRFSFPKAGKLHPAGFDGLGVGGEVMITIRGTVRELADYPNREWDPGRDVTVEMTECSFGQTGPATMADAIEKSRRRV